MPIIHFPTSFAGIDTGTLCAQLIRSHPRFIITPQVLERALRHVDEHAVAAKAFRELVAHCDALLNRPPLAEPSHGASRQILDRIVSLAALYQLTKKEKYAACATAELLASSSLPHWTPESFLSVAERSLAFALGLDWLHDSLSSTDRTAIENGLLANGLEAFQYAYACQPWWHRDTCNWNIVCNSSAILTALALHHRAPLMAEKILATALHGLPSALASFTPDGAWPEGPGYWAFAMRYLTTLLDSLDTAIPGNNLPLSQWPGLREAAYFRMACEGPTHKLFNFADSYEDAPVDPSLFSLARRYHLPAPACFNRDLLQHGRLPGYFGSYARTVLLFTPVGTQADLDPLPLDTHFSAHDIATFRTSFADPQALYLATKGGDIQAPHAHADLGTFVLDAKSHRFFLDLGPDHYDLPNFWNGRPNTNMKRWSLLRTGTHGHNAPLVNHVGQNPLATAHIVHFQSLRDVGTCTIDLTHAYSHQPVAKLTRTFEFQRNSKHVRLADAVTPTAPLQLTQHFHTTAAITIDGNTAALRIHNETITMTFACDSPFTLSVEELSSEPGAMPLENTRRLIFHTTVSAPVTVRCLIDCK